MSNPIMHPGSRNNLMGSNADSSLSKRSSNELQVTKEAPPTFLIHATDDTSVPVENSLLFYQALKNHGITVGMHLYPKGGHGFGLGPGPGYLATWMERCIDWMRGLK